MTSRDSGLRPARLGPVDIGRLGATGLRTRPVRAVLSALGIAIGIAAVVCVVGIGASSRDDLNRQLARFGTNLLRVAPGNSILGAPSHLPSEAIPMIGRIGPVTSVSATGEVADVHIYRSDEIPSGETGSIAVLAARTDLLGTVGAHITRGVWLNAATEQYPAVVLGADAASRLGIGAPSPEVRLWLGDQWFTVIGILARVPLAPELDAAALIGWPVASTMLAFDGYPTTVYTRTRNDSILDVQAVLAGTANPQHPDEVLVSRPSDALAAGKIANSTLNALLLGLGAVALLVGAVGVANTMVISVLERRSEIGLRRSLGATRGQIRVQFLVESILLAAGGGIGGVLLGIAVTSAYASYKHWPSLVPTTASIGGIAITIVIGALSGLYPAWRAARLSPTEALA